jgi:hypothetical protein
MASTHSVARTKFGQQGLGGLAEPTVGEFNLRRYSGATAFSGGARLTRSVPLISSDLDSVMPSGCPVQTWRA